MSVTNLHPHGFGPNPIFENIPQVLRDRCVWCAWSAVPRKKKGVIQPDKFDKIPHDGQRKIGTNEPEAWLTFDQAYQLYTANPGKFNGVGVLIRKGDNLTYIDVDNEDMGTLDQWVQSWPTYVERSPSGLGLRIISDGTTSRDITKPVEVYSGNAPRFVTITGAVLRNDPIVNLSADIETNLLPLEPPKDTREDLDIPEMIDPPHGFTPITFHTGDRSSEILKICLTHLHGGMTPGQVLGLMWASPEVFQYAADHRNEEWKYLPFLWVNNLMLAVSRYDRDKGEQVEYEVIPGYEDAQPAPLAEGQIRALEGISFGELNQKHFEPVRWLVDEFLPPGVTMLVGKPKFGKSWLVHAMALRIAAGGELFGHPVKRSKCIYMALEDSERRVKDRTHVLMRSMGITPAQIADNFIVMTDCARLGEGLEEQLVEQLTRDPEVRLIEIDVLAHVRGGRAGNQSLFDYDYSVGKKLKKICAQFPDLAIILVHHAAKYAVDSSEATSGTNGLNAGMDNVLVLMNGDNGPVLHIHARDVKNDEPIPMTRDHNKMWTLDSRELAAESGNSDTRNVILAAIDAGARSPKDIQHHTELDIKVIEQQLYRMVKAQVLRKAGRGSYMRVFGEDVAGDAETYSNGPNLHEPADDVGSLELSDDEPDFMK